MDLFGRKASRRVLVLETENRLYKLMLGKSEQRVTALEAENRAKDRLISTLRDHVFRTEAKLFEVSKGVPTPRKMHKTEEEEEYEYALNSGQINLDEYKALLDQAGFANTEVEIPTRPERPVVY